MVKFIESELVLLKKEIDEMWTLVSVSYTHLTLPTIA